MNAHEIALLAYTAQTESLLYGLEQVAWSIGFNVNVNETEFKWVKQDWAISILNGKPLKLLDQFTYLGSNISSTETKDFSVKRGVDITLWQGI